MLSILLMRRLAALLGLTTVLALAAVATTGLSGCKQREGDYCQVTDDCSDGLRCVAATNTCQRDVVDGVDAAVVLPVDARDAAPDGPLDAAPDAALDAAIDAVAEIDAAVPR